MMTSFQNLADSRRKWIARILRPWCAQAGRGDLLKAEADWIDLAGRPDPQATLWTWAWGRFPDLVHEGMSGVDETAEVRVTLRDGRSFTGFPDNRGSRQGQLVVVCSDAQEQTAFEEAGPFSIDDIQSVAKVHP